MYVFVVVQFFFPLLENSLSYITIPKNKQKSNLNKDKIEPQDIL